MKGDERFIDVRKRRVTCSIKKEAVNNRFFLWLIMQF